jgi:hypothetical protein
MSFAAVVGRNDKSAGLDPIPIHQRMSAGSLPFIATAPCLELSILFQALSTPCTSLERAMWTPAGHRILDRDFIVAFVLCLLDSRKELRADGLHPLINQFHITVCQYTGVPAAPPLFAIVGVPHNFCGTVALVAADADAHRLRTCVDFFTASCLEGSDGHAATAGLCKGDDLSAETSFSIAASAAVRAIE